MKLYQHHHIHKSMGAPPSGVSPATEASLEQALRAKMRSVMAEFDNRGTAADREKWARMWIDRAKVDRPKHVVWQVLGLLAGVITLAAVAVQIAQIYSRRSACDLSIWYLVGMVLNQTLWLLYGLGNCLWVNILTSAIGIAVVGWIIGLKAFYDSPTKCAAREDAVLSLSMYYSGSFARA
jgi:uncharacterized protein with PQ loop repeat